MSYGVNESINWDKEHVSYCTYINQLVIVILFYSIHLFTKFYLSQYFWKYNGTFPKTIALRNEYEENNQI